MKYILILILILLTPLAKANTKEIHCLAYAIYKEARGEGDQGMKMVGHVIMNRVAHPSFPNSICKVIKQRNQFNFKYNKEFKLDKKYYRLANIVYDRSRDITYGSLYFITTKAYNKKKKRFKNKKIKLKYKNHLFY